MATGFQDVPCFAAGVIGQLTDAAAGGKVVHAGYQPFRNDFSFSFVVALGARVQLGPRLLHGYLEAAYSPGVTFAEGRGSWTGVGYRVGAGVAIGLFDLGVGWREQRRDAETPIRAFFGTLGFGY
jgi:hypothetical protein